MESGRVIKGSGVGVCLVELISQASILTETVRSPNRVDGVRSTEYVLQNE